ncbi:MAG TPA: hypothetical protein VKZ69_04655 [Limnochordales bacterium]|nr:hypothetical protein [Limnochordales bacterium]
MDYAELRARVVGALDERRRNTEDPYEEKALHRVTSIAVWVLDQNRYKPGVELADLRDMALEEIDIYLHKMLVDGFGDRELVRAVQEAREVVAALFAQLIREAGAAQPAGKAAD